MKLRHYIGCLLLPLTLLLLTLSPAQAAEVNGVNSALWGKTGELWSASGRLPDFSFAGYHSGEAPLPNPPIKANVRDFGAKGDGVADDTDAFVRAIAAVQNGAVLVPAGRYKLTDILYIRKPNVVLRGEGTDKTTLVFPKSLEQIKPEPTKNTGGTPTNSYSWSGGLIWMQGKQDGAELGLVQTKAERGAHSIMLAAPASVSVGQRVIISQEDPGDNSLLNYLYAGQPGDTSKVTQVHISFVSRVSKVDGARLTLERPLRTNIDPHWKADVRVFQPSVTEVGIENLTFEFPANPYRGHFKEDGYNPVAFSNAADCWLRNLRFVNADSGPFLNGGTFVTAEHLVYEANRPPDKGGETGHHGFSLGNDDLLRDFDFRTRFIHDISVENGAAGNVAEEGKGLDLCFDNHKRFPYANLYTDIDVGAGTHLYRCGGGASLGRNAGAWTTFWNIRSQRPQHWPPTSFGQDLMTFVGVTSESAPVLDAAGRWFEPIPPSQLQPPNLYEAQLRRRLVSVRPASGKL